MQKLPKSFTAITQPHMIRFISTVFGRDTLCGCVCDSVRGSVGPSGKMIRFTSNKDQNVPRRSLYRPTFTPKVKDKISKSFSTVTSLPNIPRRSFYCPVTFWILQSQSSMSTNYAKIAETVFGDNFAAWSELLKLKSHLFSIAYIA